MITTKKHPILFTHEFVVYTFFLGDCINQPMAYFYDRKDALSFYDLFSQAMIKDVDSNQVIKFK